MHLRAIAALTPLLAPPARHRRPSFKHQRGRLRCLEARRIPIASSVMTMAEPSPKKARTEGASEAIFHKHSVALVLDYGSQVGAQNSSSNLQWRRDTPPPADGRRPAPCSFPAVQTHQRAPEAV